jgi:hypothetical protein
MPGPSPTRTGSCGRPHRSESDGAAAPSAHRPRPEALTFDPIRGSWQLGPSASAIGSPKSRSRSEGVGVGRFYLHERTSRLSSLSSGSGRGTGRSRGIARRSSISLLASPLRGNQHLRGRRAVRGTRICAPCPPRRLEPKWAQRRPTSCGEDATSEQGLANVRGMSSGASVARILSSFRAGSKVGRKSRPDLEPLFQGIAADGRGAIDVLPADPHGLAVQIV